MKLATRLALLFGALAAIFLGALGFLHAAQQRSAAKLRSEIAEDKARQLARLVALSGNTLERFAADYTQWDEMCAFVLSHDPAWATINLEQSVASWGFHGVWVFDAARREIYRHQRAPFTAADLAAIPSSPLFTRLCGTDRLHFFANSPRGLVEVRTAPIHPSDENRNNEPPRGWFMVARLWDEAQFAQLGTLTDSQVSLAPLPGASDPAMVETNQTLADWSGQPLLRLTLRHTSPLLANMIAYDATEVALFLAFGLVFLGVATWFVHRWVHHPLRRIEASLQTGDPALAAPLQANRDEFGRIATLIRTAAAQRETLRREIADRTAAEQELRRTFAARAALGRDLHDGVIQSIYATGMTLQGAGQLISDEPREAQRRLSTCVETLNRTITQLRSYIAGLEAPATPPVALADGLQRLLHEMHAARPVEYDVQVDPLLAAALPQDTVVQLLFIAREAVSNALRHSRAAHIALRLDTAAGDPAFTVEDDGCGFDPAAAAGRGHGLDNMTRRAEEIGASLTLESVAGRGTRVRVELPWSGLETEHPAPPVTTP